MTLNLRFDGEGARLLGIENHVCELQLLLRCMLQYAEVS